MAAQPVKTVEELAEAMRHAGPPTLDDVTVLLDGRRLDTREKVLEWVEELNKERATSTARSADA